MNVDIDRSQVAEKWKSRGFSCGTWIDAPGQSWENYIHETDELLMLLEGEMELEISGKKIVPQIGEEIFIPAKTYHSVINSGSSKNRWLYGYKTIGI